MNIEEFKNIYISEYRKVFHGDNDTGILNLSAIADFLFKPIFEVENFKFKKASK